MGGRDPRAVTVAVAVVPAFLPGAGDSRGPPSSPSCSRPASRASWRSRSSPPWCPAAAASCCRATRRSPYPISPTTDHLGALLHGAAQHRLAAPGLGPARLCGLRLRSRNSPRPIPVVVALDGRRHRSRAGGRVDDGGGTPPPARDPGRARPRRGRRRCRARAAPQRPTHRAARPGADGLVHDRATRRPDLALGADGRGRARPAWSRPLLGILPAPASRRMPSRRGAARERVPRRPPVTALGPARPDPYRPLLGVADRPDASRHAGAAVGPGLVAIVGTCPGPRWRPARLGRVRWRPAVRRQRLVPRRPRRPVAREPARRARPGLRGARDLRARSSSCVAASASRSLLGVAARRRTRPGRARGTGLHLARGHGAGRIGRDALVGPAAVRRRPALGPGDPRAAERDGRLLDTAGGQHDPDRGRVLRPRPGARLAGVAAGGRSVPGLVGNPAAAHPRHWRDPVQRARVVTAVAA